MRIFAGTRFRLAGPVAAVASLAAVLGSPLAAHAQGVIIEDRTVGMAPMPDGVLISEVERPRFRQYVVEEQVPSYEIEGSIAVGTVLPEAGIVLYDVPQRYSPTTFRYTVVNDHTVLVNPRTRRIMQVVD